MPAVNAVVDLSREGDIAVISVDSPPVNALSAAVRDGLRDAIALAAADPFAKAIVLICAGRTFIAGADIAEFGKPASGASLPDVQAAIEDCRKPVVAAMHGSALGGGFEVALVCHYRVAVASAKFGLPEIKLGMIPGAGGTQRLTRLIGPKDALDIILSGKPFGAAQALAWGAIDGLVEEGDLRAGAIAFARRAVDEGFPLRRVRDVETKVAAARGKPAIFEAARLAYARKYRGFEAWEKAIAAVRDAVELPFEEGLARERAAFLRLRGSDQSRALRHVFFAERRAGKFAGLAENAPTTPIAKVGVVGAGTMGAGIAMAFLDAGFPVALVETRREALDRGVAAIKRNYEGAAGKGRMTAAEAAARMDSLAGGLDLAALADCDLVIEAAFEDMSVKQALFAKLGAIAKPRAILASNTSYLDLDAIAAAAARPERVVGLHFFSPANVMRLVEVVRGARTDALALATARHVAKRIGKVAVLAGACSGFIGNRMLAQRQREAQKLILEGATPWDVDRVLHAFGMPMGPFAMRDLAGLDLGWSKDKSSSASLRDILCEMGRFGQKSGAGFYDYGADRQATPSLRVEAIIRDFAARQGIAPRAISDAEILGRCLYPMVNEGAKLLEEGIAQRASDIDVVWINGFGWPAYRGGPMFHADAVGLDKILAGMREFEARLGAEFKPAALLERLAAAGRGFGDS